MSNYRVISNGDMRLIKKNGKVVATRLGEMAIIKTKSLAKFIVGERTSFRVKNTPKSLRLAKREISRLESMLWQ